MTIYIQHSDRRRRRRTVALADQRCGLLSKRPGRRYHLARRDLFSSIELATAARAPPVHIRKWRSGNAPQPGPSAQPSGLVITLSCCGFSGASPLNAVVSNERFFPLDFPPDNPTFRFSSIARSLSFLLHGDVNTTTMNAT